MIPRELEIAAMRACLSPLGDYVGDIGMERPLADYSREEVLTLVEVVVTPIRRTCSTSMNAWQPESAPSSSSAWRARS